MPEKTKCGYVAIIGRPNVGKSTLLNKILGQKISITARKPQTTRHRILGIKTNQNVQTLYVDTPGLHAKDKRALNRYMNKTVANVLADVNAIVFMVVANIWKEDDELVLERLQDASCPIFLVINQVDRVKNKDSLLPYIEKLAGKFQFSAIVPLSAKTGANVAELETKLQEVLPVNNFFFPEEQVTDKNERFLVAEIVREKLTRLLGQEVPHALTVVVEKFVVEQKITRIAVVIYVERDGQKAIVIGKDGAKLKRIGSDARKDIENMLDSKVFLQLWVKVKQGWSDDVKALRNFGYGDE